MNNESERPCKMPKFDDDSFYTGSSSDCYSFCSSGSLDDDVSIGYRIDEFQDRLQALDKEMGEYYLDRTRNEERISEIVEEIGEILPEVYHLIKASGEAIQHFFPIINFISYSFTDDDGEPYSDDVDYCYKCVFFRELHDYLAISRRWEELHWLADKTWVDIFGENDTGTVPIEFFTAFLDAEPDKTTQKIKLEMIKSLAAACDYVDLEKFHGRQGFHLFKKYLNTLSVSHNFEVVSQLLSVASIRSDSEKYCILYFNRIVRAFGDVRELLLSKKIEASIFDRFVDPLLPKMNMESPLRCLLLSENERKVDDSLLRLLLEMTPTYVFNLKDPKDHDSILYNQILRRKDQKFSDEQLEKLKPVENPSTSYPYEKMKNQATVTTLCL